MDKKLNEVTKVTDMAYVPVIMADGSIGQIAKADLATVVAGEFMKANQPTLSIPSDKYTAIGVIWGRDYKNTNSAAYVFVASVGGKIVYMYELGREGSGSITATISGREVTFLLNSIDEFYYIDF